MTTSTGCMLGWYDANGYSGTNGLGDMETLLGTHFAMVRVYNQWWPDLSGVVTNATSAGRLVLSSHKPPKTANSWVAIARGDHDSAITSMVNFYKGLAPAEVIFIFNHEPHTNGSDAANKAPTYGKMSDFVGAYRRIAKAFRDANATNVKLGYCAVANFWACRGTPVGTGDAGYPGDDVVDVLCHDDYNFFNGLNPANWDSMQTVMQDSVALAKRLKKPLIWGELGSQYGTAGKSRETWFTDGAAYLKTGDAATYTLGFCYYHVDNHNNSGHYWRFAQGAHTDGKTAFISKFSQDSYFRTQPIPVSLRKATPPAGVAPTAVASGGGIPSNIGYGKPTVSFASGPLTLISVGAIPSPADYQDPEESPGLDFGTLTVTVSALPSFGGIFSPPVRDLVAPILPESTGPEWRLFRHYKSRARGVTVITKTDGSCLEVETPTQLTYADNDPASSFVEQGLAEIPYSDIARVYTGGHIYRVDNVEVAQLVACGYGANITYLTWESQTGTWQDLAGLPWGEL
jgi:hypothetical protein